MSIFIELSRNLARRFLPGTFEVGVGTAVALLASLIPSAVGAQASPSSFTIDDILSLSFPYGLVGASSADRIAWMENDRGMRNVFTAAAPDYVPVRLTSTDSDDAIDLTSVQLSADGAIVAFIRGHTMNFSGRIGNQGSHADGGKREIWAAYTSGEGTAWRVVAALDLNLSPDGRWALHVRDGKIYRAPVIPADPNSDFLPPLFETLGTNSNPVWSPDGSKVAFVTSRSDQRQYFPTQGSVATHSFVAVYDVAEHRITYLTPSVDFDSNPVWSPDGTRVAFVRRPGLPFGHFAADPLETITREQVPPGFLTATFEGGYALGIWIADIETGEGYELWHTLPGDNRFTSPGSLRWSGDHLLFQAEPGNWRHWFSISTLNPEVEPVLLTPGEGEVENAVPSQDGRWLYYTANIGDLDRRHLWRVPVSGGVSEQLTGGTTIETLIAVPGSGEKVATLHSGPRQPVSVAIFPAEGGEGRIIGPELPEHFPVEAHVVPETVVIAAADGLSTHSIVFTPADLQPGERRPALLYIHGGGGRSVLGYPDQSNGFYHMSYGVIQYLVNKGYIVAAVNYRGGSALYGKAFRNPAGYGANGVSEYRDVLAAGEWLRDHPAVDPSRIGVFGLSYGGWLTGQALSRNSDIFRAGAIFAGVQLRSTSLDPQSLAFQSSPAYNIDRWTSPTLVIHGDDDRNVEFSQTIGLINLFRARGIPHELIVFPDDTHYFGYFHRWLRSFNAIDAFFDRHILNSEDESDS